MIKLSKKAILTAADCAETYPVGYSEVWLCPPDLREECEPHSTDLYGCCYSQADQVRDMLTGKDSDYFLQFC